MKNIFYHNLLILSASILFLSGCASGNSFHSVEGMIWNTVYHVTYSGPSELADSIIPTLQRVDNSVSAFNDNSIVSRINTNTSDQTDEIFRLILRESKKVYQSTDGYFDPSVKPAIDAWGFGKEHDLQPDTARLDSLRQFVGLNKIEIGQLGNVVKTDPRLELNFSAIAKGFGADEVGRMLSCNGVSDFMVEIGGETVLHGMNRSGTAWNIAIETPTPDAAAQSTAAIIIKTTDCGIATSGNYRNYRSDGSTRFGHTIDPRTCRPASTDVLSATVIAPTSMLADAYATAFMAMGSIKARELAENLKLSVFLILSDNSYWESSQFKKIPQKQ